MTREVTVARLIDLAAARFGRTTAGLTADSDMFESLGVDSVQVLELLSELEQEFAIEIPDYELRGVKTFADLAAVVARRV